MNVNGPSVVGSCGTYLLVRGVFPRILDEALVGLLFQRIRVRRSRRSVVPVKPYEVARDAWDLHDLYHGFWVICGDALAFFLPGAAGGGAGIP